MVVRLGVCQDLFASFGMFKKACLFNDAVVPDPIKSNVANCVDTSFELLGDLESNNKILESDMTWTHEHHLDFHPSITINNFTYRGDIEFADIREAICAAY